MKGPRGILTFLFNDFLCNVSPFYLMICFVHCLLQLLFVLILGHSKEYPMFPFF